MRSPYMSPRRYQVAPYRQDMYEQPTYGQSLGHGAASGFGLGVGFNVADAAIQGLGNWISDE
jgi:hypothetical protein